MPDDALNTTAIRAKATELQDPFAPIFHDDESGGERKYGFDCGDAERDELVVALRQTHEHFNPVAPVDDAILAHALALVHQLPSLHLIPKQDAETNTRELQWGRVRCIFAGLGFNYHAPIARACNRLSPWCPIEPTDTIEEWEKNARGAHETSGWPWGLLLLRWERIRYAAGASSTPLVCDWHRLVALSHLLKHLRLQRSEDLRVVCLYQGQVATVQCPGNVDRVCTDREIGWLAARLGQGTIDSPLALALQTRLRHLHPADLLCRLPLAGLPPQVFHSPGAHTAPDVGSFLDYFQHGLTLDGVRIATCGQVMDYRSLPASADDVLGYQWPATQPSTVTPEQHQAWGAGLPDTYDDTLWPSDVVTEYFPNMVWLDDAHRAYFDAVMVAQMSRAQVPELAAEFPALCFLPKDATPELSTKQGKSTLAKAVLHALAPCAGYRIDNGAQTISARNLAWEIHDHGTHGFDEFALSKQPESPANRSTLQTLCTGGLVGVATVRENRGASYRLTAPLVLQAKYLDLPDDLDNRFYLYWLDRLSAEAWADQRRFLDAESGRMSVRLRLAALAKSETMNLAAWLPTQPLTSNEQATRYPVHRLITARILQLKHGTEALDFAAIDGCVHNVKIRLSEHLTQAQESGLTHMLDESVSAAKLTLDTFFDGLDEGGLRNYYTQLKGVALERKMSIEHDRFGVPAICLLQARARQFGATSQAGQQPLAQYLAPILHKSLRDLSDRALARAVANDLKVRAVNANATDNSFPLPGMHGLAGWRMQTMAVDGSGARYTFYNDIERVAALQRPAAKSPLAHSP